MKLNGHIAWWIAMGNINYSRQLNDKRSVSSLEFVSRTRPSVIYGLYRGRLWSLWWSLYLVRLLFQVLSRLYKALPSK